jgi:fibronectin type 3 domain-containing protein
VATDSSPEGVSLTWEMEETDNVDGFRIYRSKKFKDNYEILADSLSVIQHSFLDQSPLPTGYYRLQAYNSDENSPLSTPKMVQIIDSIPPAVPTGLKAKADSLGHVYLKWKANADSDVLGYRIFRANARHEEFSQLTGSTVLTNNYTDSINIKTLSKKVYYKILAVDQRQNWSGFSEILEVKRPDVVPPASPLITSINSTSDGIELEWNKSPGDDVMWQLIYRNKEGSHDWELIEKLTAEATTFKDSLVTPDVLYRYLVMAVDSAGNESKPGKAVGGRMPASKLEVVKNLDVMYDKNEKAAKLQWTYQRDDVVFMIYRKKNRETVLVASTDANTFIDPFASIEEDVYYSVVVKSNDRGRSGFSEFVKIRR